MSSVLMYSGGFDSVAARILVNPDVLVYVMTGSAYTKAEMARLPGGFGIRPDTHIVNMTALKEWERPDRIMPLRNLFFACVGAQYADDVMLAATAGDKMFDKTQTFAQLATSLLDYLWAPQHWTEGRDIRVVLPVKGYTKRGLVQAVRTVAQEAGLQELARSLSCYTPHDDGTECGECGPCARKWVAFAAEGLAHMVPDARAYVEAQMLPKVKAHTSGRVQAEDNAVCEALTRT